MLSLLAIFAIVRSIGTIPIFTILLFAKTQQDGLASKVGLRGTCGRSQYNPSVIERIYPDGGARRFGVFRHSTPWPSHPEITHSARDEKSRVAIFPARNRFERKPNRNVMQITALYQSD